MEKQSSLPPTLYWFYIVLVSYWLDSSHMVSPSCEGGWECRVAS